jgi:hypothetical protein
MAYPRHVMAMVGAEIAPQDINCPMRRVNNMALDLSFQKRQTHRESLVSRLLRERLYQATLYLNCFIASYQHLFANLNRKKNNRHEHAKTSQQHSYRDCGDNGRPECDLTAPEAAASLASFLKDAWQAKRTKTRSA